MGVKMNGYFTPRYNKEKISQMRIFEHMAQA